MGIDKDKFKEPLNVRVICVLCKDVLLEPVQSYCQHTFCRNCIKDWLSNQRNKHCPSCDQPLTHRDLVEASGIIPELLDDLEMRCLYHESGCEEFVGFDLLMSHCSQCPFKSIVKCGFNCGAHLDQQELGFHSCVNYLLIKLNEKDATIDILRQEVEDLTNYIAFHGKAGLNHNNRIELEEDHGEQQDGVQETDDPALVLPHFTWPRLEEGDEEEEGDGTENEEALGAALISLEAVPAAGAGVPAISINLFIWTWSVNALLGLNKTGLQEMAALTGTQISVWPDCQDEKRVNIIGPADSVEKAQTLIFDRIELEEDTVFRLEMIAPSSRSNAIKDKLRQFEASTGATFGVSKEIVDKDGTPIVSVQIVGSRVSTESAQKAIRGLLETHAQYESMTETHQKLVDLGEADVATNVLEAFECPICFVEIEVGEGIVLKECLHSFCRECLVDTVKHTEHAVVMCPFADVQYSCESFLQEREIKAIVSPELYEEYLKRSLDIAEVVTPNSFHCKTTDCRGWCEFDDNVNTFLCPVCGQQNCLNCQAVHKDMDCKQYQEKVTLEAAHNQEAKITKKYLEDLLTSGEAMNCPKCLVVVIKKVGCDWIQCTMCRTELCWATKGPRWGPAGRGDVTGGCKCKAENGQLCHPRCGNCH